MDMSSIMHIWDHPFLLEQHTETLLCFLYYKMYIKYTPELLEIILSGNNVLSKLKRYYKSITKSSPGKSSPGKSSPEKYSPEKSICSPGKSITRTNKQLPSDDYMIKGWIIYDYKYVDLLPNCKYHKSIVKEWPKPFQDIGVDILFYIRSKFKTFKYLNINENYSNRSKLSAEICKLFYIDQQKYNYTEQQLMNVNKSMYKSISFITITNLCHFYNIDKVLNIIYKLLSKDGYILMKDFDLQNEHDSYLYDTFYDLYRVLYDEIPIEIILKEKKQMCYKNIEGWILLFAQFGFEFVAKNKIKNDDTHYDDLYLIFTKVEK